MAKDIIIYPSGDTTNSNPFIRFSGGSDVNYIMEMTSDGYLDLSIEENIVTSGLTLYLDAGNYESYSGGTTWYDLEGTNNGVLTNGPVYDNGSIVFDGSNDYVAINNLGLSSHTIEGWFNSSDGSQGGGAFSTICSIFGNYDGGSSKYTYIGLIPNLTFRIDDGVTSHTNVATVSYSANIWYYVALTYNASDGVTKAYVNGSQVGNTTFTTNITFNSIPHNIAKTQANVYFDGLVASHKAYNRALSSTEILQNYNATKHRFGL